MTDTPPEFLIACLCAAWCGTCRDYRAGFDALAAHFPEARFLWLDVEDDAELLDDYEVETFPTLLIQRHELQHIHTPTPLSRYRLITVPGGGEINHPPDC